VLPLGLLLAVPLPLAGQVRVERFGVVMGTELRVEVAGADRSEALAAAEAALREIEQMDALLTTWNPGSPMSALNRAQVGTPTRTDAKLIALLGEAERWAAHTGRAFDPTIGPLIDAWGLRRGGARPDSAGLAAARAAVGAHAFRVDAERGALTRLHPAAWIDTGAFGKGAALRSARDSLRARGVRSALLDLGGQLLALGRDGVTGGPWRIRVAHPARRREPVATLLLTEVSVATSGNSERAAAVDGEPIAHLIDARTGRPAPVWGSVTVVGPDPLVADVLSSALYVMGPAAGLAWVEALGEAAGPVGALFLVERDGALVPCWNATMERWLDPSFTAAAPARGRSCS